MCLTVCTVARDGDEDEDAEPENCAAPLTCKEKDLLRYYYYIHNGIATKYVAGRYSRNIGYSLTVLLARDESRVVPEDYESGA